jgi:hypothetical protein
VKIVTTGDYFGWNDGELRVFWDFSGEEPGPELKTRTALNARKVLEGCMPRTPVNRPANIRKTSLHEEIFRIKEVTA